MNMENKLMSLEVLSSIKGATESEAVNKLFTTVKEAVNADHDGLDVNSNITVGIDDLREDTVIASSDKERALIMQNFPLKKNGYLMVSKVIED